MPGGAAVQRTPAVSAPSDGRQPPEDLRSGKMLHTVALLYKIDKLVPVSCMETIDAHPDAHYALTCRTYHLEDGRVSPLSSLAMLRRAVAARP